MKKTATSLQCDQCLGTQFLFLFSHHHQWKVQKCTSCSLTQVIPRPTKKEVAKLYEHDFDHFSPYLDQLAVHHAYFQKKIQGVTDALKISDFPRRKKKAGKWTLKKTLLDIGCAMGVLLQEAQRKGFRAEGVDISSDAVSYCRKQGLTATVGSVGSYAKKTKKKFHVITAFEIIEHEYAPREMIETIYRLLYEDGLAIVTTPNHGSIWRIVMGKYWPGYQHTEHLFFFDEASLWNLFTSVGFTHVEIRKDDSRPFPLSFLFTRAADYFPLFGPILKIIGTLLAPLPLTNPINPWDDLIVIARK